VVEALVEEVVLKLELEETRRTAFFVRLPDVAAAAFTALAAAASARLNSVFCLRNSTLNWRSKAAAAAAAAFVSLLAATATLAAAFTAGGAPPAAAAVAAFAALAASFTAVSIFHFDHCD